MRGKPRSRPGCRTRSRRGVSLTEVLVYSGLMGLVLSAVYAAFTPGLRYYRATQSNVEIQQGAQAALQRLAGELMESNLGGIRFYPNSSYPGVPSGIVLISPRSPSAPERVGLNPLTGRARWYKYVCYYVGPDDTPGRLALYRKEYVPSGLNPDARPTPCPYTTDWFRSSSSRAQVVARDLAPVSSAYPYGGFEAFSGDPETSAPERNSPANPVCLLVTSENRDAGGANRMTSRILVNVRN
ncbi:MAG TPA: hypothetical protein VNO81_07105 [Candidatus Nitrosotenuis sp.]|nr:hypothetical protein [Candidatus Nitrosotenuis sp.]